jgi:hypothetical protein
VEAGAVRTSQPLAENEDEVRAVLLDRLSKWGAATTLQHEAGVSHAAVCQIRKGARINPKIAKVLGYKLMWVKDEK